MLVGVRLDQNGVERGDDRALSIRAAVSIGGCRPARRKFRTRAGARQHPRCWSSGNRRRAGKNPNPAPQSQSELRPDTDNILDVIDGDRETSALRIPRRHGPKQIGCKRGNAAFARQIVAKKRDVRMLETVFTTGPTFFPLFAAAIAGGLSDVLATRARCRSRGIDEDLAHVRSSTVPIGSFLALDTTRRPRHGCEAFWADRRFALHAGSKGAVVNPSQCGFHVAQQAGLTVHVSNGQSRSEAYWISSIWSALFSIAMSSRFRRSRPSSAAFRSRTSWNPPSVCAVFMVIPFARAGRLPSLARDGPDGSIRRFRD